MENLNTEENETLLSNLNKEEKVQWQRAHENILTDWGDKAMCYRWMHSNANSKYNRLNAMFTIPVIVISTMTGTANFAQEKFGEYKELAVILIGSFNILAGIIQTIQQFLKIGELNESHRASGISWDKFYRNIKVEMAKAPTERTPVDHMLKNCKEEFDRLMETSPRIPDEIILKFNNLENKGKRGNKNVENFMKISKPEICGNLETTKNFRYIERLEIKIDKDVDSQKAKINTINKFIKDFVELKKRTPYIDELMTNMQDKLSDISESEMQKLLDNYIVNSNKKTSNEGKGDVELVSNKPK